MPRENPATVSSRRSARPARSSAASTRRSTSVERVDLREEAQVLRGGELRIEIEVVAEQADARAQRRAARPRRPTSP